jgi:prophage regulatory protein
MKHERYSLGHVELGPLAAPGRRSKLFEGSRCNTRRSHATSEMLDRILRLRAVLERTGLSRSTMYRKMQNGSFPRNIQISDRCIGWRQSAVDAWISSPMCYSADADR